MKNWWMEATVPHKNTHGTNPKSGYVQLWVKYHIKEVSTYFGTLDCLVFQLLTELQSFFVQFSILSWTEDRLEAAFTRLDMFRLSYL